MVQTSRLFVDAELLHGQLVSCCRLVVETADMTEPLQARHNTSMAYLLPRCHASRVLGNVTAHLQA